MAEASSGSDGEGRSSRTGRKNKPDGRVGEIGGGHFCKGPWLSLCSALDAPAPEEGASDSEGELKHRERVQVMSCREDYPLTYEEKISGAYCCGHVLCVAFEELVVRVCCLLQSCRV